jgi:hypothetical protein
MNFFLKKKIWNFFPTKNLNFFPHKNIGNFFPKKTPDFIFK